MAINASTVWRVRIGGNDDNGGAFDPEIVGAGTDYTEQDIAQLTLTDLTTSGASAVVSSATGGFTSAMIGNAIRIASGTNFTVGTYFIVAVGSTNSATLDRNCSTASGSGGVGRVGGAHATPLRASLAGFAAGNTILIRGQGSNEPVDIDYFVTAAVNVAGCTVIGYNGRPKISHTGLFTHATLTTNVLIKGLYFVQSSTALGTTGVVRGAGSTAVIDCVFDQAGFDSTQIADCSAINCSFINSGTQLSGTRAAVTLNTNNPYGAVVERCHVKDQRGDGVSMTFGRGTVRNSIIQNCQGNGITIATSLSTAQANVPVCNNTIHDNLGHGIQIDAPQGILCDNIISNHTGSGKHGIFWSAAPVGYARDYTRVARNNFHGNTTNSNYALSALDTTIDPQYVNAPTDLTPQNTALRYLSGVGSL